MPTVVGGGGSRREPPPPFHGLIVSYALAPGRQTGNVRGVTTSSRLLTVSSVDSVKCISNKDASRISIS